MPASPLHFWANTASRREEEKYGCWRGDFVSEGLSAGWLLTSAVNNLSIMLMTRYTILPIVMIVGGVEKASFLLLMTFHFE
jgi:hypothetical protein